jgi:hypothetical protein
MGLLKIVILALFIISTLSLTISDISVIGCKDDDYYFSFSISPPGELDDDVTVKLSSPTNADIECEVSDEVASLVVCDIDSKLKDNDIILSSVTYKGNTVFVTDTIAKGVTCNISFIKIGFGLILSLVLIF